MNEPAVTRLAPRFSHFSRSFALAVVVALALRLIVGFVFLGSMPMVNDAGDYMRVAVRLAHSFPGDRAHYWPPGLPLLLSAVFRAFGATVAVGRLLTIIVDTVNVALIFALAVRLFGAGRTAITSAWIAALYPPAILLSSQTYSQSYATTALLVASLAILRLLDSGGAYWALAAGFALGGGILVRPSMLSVAGLAGGLGCVLAVRAVRRHATPPGRTWLLWVGAGVVALLLPVVPMMQFNAGEGAGWVISTNNERNLWLGNNPYTPDYKTGHLAFRSIDQLDLEASAYIRSFVDRPDARAAMRAETLRYVKSHPFRTGYRTLNRIRAFWGFDFVMAREIQKYFELSSLSLAGLLVFEAGGYIAVGILAIAGLVACLGLAERATAWTAALTVLGYAAPYALSFASGSYHFPVVAFLIPFAACGLSSLFGDGVRQPRRLTLALWAVFLAVQVEYAYWILKMA